MTSIVLYMSLCNKYIKLCSKQNTPWIKLFNNLFASVSTPSCALKMVQEYFYIYFFTIIKISRLFISYMRREPMAVKIKNSNIAKKLISIALCSRNIAWDLAIDANYSFRVELKGIVWFNFWLGFGLRLVG